MNGEVHRSQTLGVDLGGSHVSATLVDGEGRIVDRAERGIEDRRPDPAIATICDAIDEVLGRAMGTVEAIGLGSPGNIDVKTGTIRYSPNFGWRDVPLGKRLSDRFGIATYVANDARCATLGEHTYGAGRGVANFVLLTLGTGIGGGIVAEGTLVLGNDAVAGEVGHHQIRSDDGFYCNCGKVGCFEAQASGTGLVRHALAIEASFPTSTLTTGDRARLGSKAICDSAAAKEPHGLAAWDRYTDDLARGIANVVTFVNPEVVALGGGVAAAGAMLLDALGPKVAARTTMLSGASVAIVRAHLGNDAGPIGAATMARRGGLIARTAAADASVSA